MTENIKNLDEYRTLEEIIKKKWGSDKFIFGVVLENGDYLTFINPNLLDIQLTYLIQTLKDRRQMRLEFI